MSFRIAELQTLLATCGRSRSGRKHELLGRAVSLLKSSEGSAMRERVKSRILELYHQRYSNGTAPSPPPTNMNGSVTTCAASTPYSAQPYIPFSGTKDVEQSTYLNRPNQNFHKQVQYSQSQHRTGNNLQVVSNINGGNKLYERAMHPASIMPTNPDVKFIPLPFYELQDILYKPVSLQAKTLSGYQDQLIQYHLTPYQTQLITNSRSVHIKSMIEYSIQVQLRFCLNETSCVQEDLYPTRCKIIVNGKGIPLPGQPPPNAQNQEPRKPHRPVNITSYCRLSPMQSNQIQVQWMPSDLGKQYAATIHLVKIVQSETLIQNLESKPIRSKAHSIGFIKEKLSPDPDSEVAMTSLKVSLCCPIGRTRMGMPCRGNNCKHLQCFDGSTYIQMNERKPSWVCPVCDQKAYYDDLFKDGLFMSIISEATSCEDIVFFEDGSWRPLEDIQQGQDNCKPLPETPKAKSSVATCDTPPVLTIATPDAALSRTSNEPTPVSVKNIPPMPSLDFGPRSNDINSQQQQQQQDIPNGTDEVPKPSDEDVEVIVLDDTDDEDSASPTVGTAVTSQPSSTVIPFSDPDLQGLELYKLLPHEDRIAAAMYLDQNGIIGQLANGSNPAKSSQNSVIDISDE